jgi:glutamate synthase (NADPH) small chain
VLFELNCEVGTDIGFDEIRRDHDAVLIATGVYKSRELGGPGAGLPGIVRAIDYLTASNRKGFGDTVPEFDSGELNAEGKRVVVIGGGDTAMDCVRTAVRQGAVSVKCLYRRDRSNMPGSQREVANAEEEGVEFVWLAAPRGFVGEAAVTGVRVARMRLGPPDVTGRQSPEEIPGADYTEDADLVIKALGFEPEDLPRLWGTEGSRSRAGAPSRRTSAPSRPACPASMRWATSCGARASSSGRSATGARRRRASSRTSRRARRGVAAE